MLALAPAGWSLGCNGGPISGRKADDLGPSPAGDGDSGTGGSGAVGATEFGSCPESMPGVCADGLECVRLDTSAYCVKTCTLGSGSECDASQACGPQYLDGTRGFCATKRKAYEVCTHLHTCGSDAICLGFFGPSRCSPICDTGTLTGATAVAACPVLPATLTSQAPTCTAISSFGSQFSICGAEVAVGEACDQAVLRCNGNDTRPDTDGGAEPATANGPDAGALRCLLGPDGGPDGEPTCQRLCSVDQGVNQSPCTCPQADPACADPSDPNLGWGCEAWDGLASGLRACVWIEDCTASGSECADNTGSRFVACTPSPYSTGPSRVCRP